MTSKHRTDRDLLRHIGERIAVLRRARGLTQAALAELAGTEPATLSRWETGARGPSITALAGIAKALGVGVGDLADQARSDHIAAMATLGAILADATDEQRELVARIAAEVVRAT